MINIEYDKDKVGKKEILSLSNAVQKIVSEKTKIKDVFVYANSSEIRVKVAPIEIFVRISDHKIKDLSSLFNEIKSDLSGWKRQSKFKHPLNLTLIPMNWKFETGI